MNSMKVSVLVFPGTNCDHDVEHLFGNLLGAKVTPIWHRSSDIESPDLVVVPGGFSYGDYLRTGALAKLSPVMKAVKKYADAGGKVLGVCNGFQILCETGLLPGALLQNRSQRFAAKFVHIKVESQNNFLTNDTEKGSIITCPVAHFEGNYFADDATITALEKNSQIAFRYCDRSGVVDAANTQSNFNGSLNAIAGIQNSEGNVVGLMPHPERAAEKLVGSVGGDSGMALFAKMAA